MKRSIGFCMCLAVLLSCNDRPKGVTLDTEVSNPEQTVAPDRGVQVVEGDTTIYTFEYTPASLDDYKTYFPENNRYADWPEDDPRETVITAIIEKNGKAAQIKVNRSSGEEKLDEEAVRLIREADITPMKNELGEPVRSKWTIVVFFPSKHK